MTVIRFSRTFTQMMRHTAESNKATKKAVKGLRAEYKAQVKTVKVQAKEALRVELDAMYSQAQSEARAVKAAKKADPGLAAA